MGSSEDTVTPRNRIGFWLGPILFIWIGFFTTLDAERPLVSVMAGIAALMAVWWISEAVPIPATALLPAVLFPLTGIMKGAEAAKEYMDSIIMLFLGGFLIAIAVERSNLHKRIALNIVALIGGRPANIVLGFMIAVGFLSMWLSNTACTMMMLPIGLSIVILFEEQERKLAGPDGELRPRSKNFSIVLMLALAHASSIGGIATLIGSPTNGVLVNQFSALYPEAPPISFAGWMLFATPMSVVFLFASWFLLCHIIFPVPKEGPISGKGFILDELRGLGPMTTEEKRVGAVFAATALLWITRSNIPFGESFTFPGWTNVFTEESGIRKFIDDGTVSISMALLLFALPAGRLRGPRLLDWEDTGKVPWGILLLFGGGLALAKGFDASGLSTWMGNEFQTIFSESNPVFMVMGVSALTAGITEMTSNTATVAMTLPVLGPLAVAMKANPLLLMIPATVAASCAFMLPVSTPPNAIVYGSGKLTINDMIKAGIALEILSILVITLATFTLGAAIFGLTGEIPDWAVTAK